MALIVSMRMQCNAQLALPEQVQILQDQKNSQTASALIQQECVVTVDFIIILAIMHANFVLCKHSKIQLGQH